jgi:hypothetical protein
LWVSAAAATPDDPSSVVAAFRFGWAIAELRGRYRPGVSHVEELPPGPAVKRTEHALPLASERSPKEQRIEVFKIVAGLSEQLDLTFTDADGATMASKLDGPIRELDKEPEKHTAWNQLTETFYEWDAQVQDGLAMQPLRSAAYQLGRGLAETYWELDPDVADALDSRSWDVVLGEPRRLALKRSTARLSAYLEPLTIPAVCESLDAWGEVASEPAWRQQPNARRFLFRQGLLWRDLVRGERRPEDLTLTRGVIGRIGMILPVLRAFWPQILIGVLAVAALVVGASQLAAETGSKSGNTLLSILGGLGLTSASLYARAKAAATSTFDALRRAFEAERVGAAATLRPKPPLTRTRVKRLPATAAKTLGYR